MGVSGSGKSTLGKMVAAKMRLPFFDGDDFHSAENLSKMASGHPLDDRDRAGWLESLSELIREQNRHGKSPIIACSALKISYREKLRRSADEVYFIHLSGSRELISQRIAQRSRETAHFMPPSLLDSQLHALEDPGAEAAVLSLDIAESPDILAARIFQFLQPKFQ